MKGKGQKTTVPKFIDPVLAKTSPKPSFSIIENERFGLVLAKTGFFGPQMALAYRHDAMS
jgi:hypothetical protein